MSYPVADEELKKLTFSQEDARLYLNLLMQLDFKLIVHGRIDANTPLHNRAVKAISDVAGRMK